MSTLTLDERKTFGNPNLRLPKFGDFPLKKTPKNRKLGFSQVEMFLPTFFPNWVARLMLYGQKGFNFVSSN